MRHFDDWIGEWESFTDDSEPPTLFKKWVAVSSVAACLERKCWVEWREGRLYGNMYIVLVGPSGSRKGTAMSPATRILRQLPLRLCPDATTRESIVRKMSESEYALTDDDKQEPHSSLTIISPELAVLIGDAEKNRDLVMALTDWFDCADVWSYETIRRGSEVIEGVWVNLLGAMTPHLVRKSFPKDAIGGGLTSRIIFVYGDKKSCLAPLTFMTKAKADQQELLSEDLLQICNLSGNFTPTPKYVELFRDWYLHQEHHKAIEDLNFEPYLTRRPIHAIKLSMIMCAARGATKSLTPQHLIDAVTLLEETEYYMPDVFRSAGQQDLAPVFETVMAKLMREGSVYKSELLRMCYRDVTKSQLDTIVETLTAIGFAKTRFHQEKGRTEVLLEYTGNSLRKGLDPYFATIHPPEDPHSEGLTSTE